METQIDALKFAVMRLETANPLNAARLAKDMAAATLATLEAIAERLKELEASLDSLRQASQGRPHG